MTAKDAIWVKEIARKICAKEARRCNFADWQIFLKGDYDHEPWMRIASQAVIAGMAIGGCSHAD